MEKTNVTVAREFGVSADRVFEAWLKPELIRQWMFGPVIRREEVLEIRTDPRVGGTFSFVVRRDGARLNHQGKYLEIEPARTLSFTWGIEGESEGESVVAIRIERMQSGGCRLTLTHGLEPAWKDYAESVAGSWNLMLSKIADYYRRTDARIRAHAQMQIRRPVKEVFEAFIDPEITKNFWFTKGSGRLEEGSSVTWDWEMYNVSSKVHVREVVPDRKIAIDWDEPATFVDFDFQPLGDGATYVQISHYGFLETDEALIAVINDTVGGFTTVLDGLKAYLEYGIRLNLVGDKFPKGVTQHGN